jgi:hypothetical protein
MLMVSTQPISMEKTFHDETYEDKKIAKLLNKEYKMPRHNFTTFLSFKPLKGHT